MCYYELIFIGGVVNFCSQKSRMPYIIVFRSEKGSDALLAETPVPIVTDMDSDGINEVVMVTKDGQLEILRVPMEMPDNHGFLPELQVVNKTQLPLETEEDGKKSLPVAMDTGYLDEYMAMVQVRKQVRPFKIECVFCIRIFWKLNARAQKHNTYPRNLHEPLWSKVTRFQWNH